MKLTNSPRSPPKQNCLSVMKGKIAVHLAKGTSGTFSLCSVLMETPNSVKSFCPSSGSLLVLPHPATMYSCDLNIQGALCLRSV